MLSRIFGLKKMDLYIGFNKMIVKTIVIFIITKAVSGRDFCERREPDLLQTLTEEELLKIATISMEDFRHLMRNGDAELNIPVQDPLYIKQLKGDHSIAMFDINSEAKGLVVPGLSNYTLKKLTAFPEKSAFKFEVLLEEIKASGSFIMNIDLISLIPYTVKDVFEVEMKGVNLRGTLHYYIRDGKMGVTSIQLTATEEKVQVNLENFFASHLVRESGLLLRFFYKPYIRTIEKMFEDSMMVKFQSEYYSQVLNRLGILSEIDC